jgi:hypothetical protein
MAVLGADLLISFPLVIFDARCWTYEPGCGGPLFGLLQFVFYASLLATGVGVVGALLLFALSLIAPKDEPSQTERTASLQERRCDDEDPLPGSAKSGQMDQSDWSPEAVDAEL